MHSDQDRSLRDHGRLLRKGFVPPYDKAIGGDIVRRINLVVVQFVV